jgi:hypothetical protein
MSSQIIRKSTREFALEIFELWELFEARPAMAFATLPQTAPRWKELKVPEAEDRALLNRIDADFHDFPISTSVSPPHQRRVFGSIAAPRMDGRDEDRRGRRVHLLINVAEGRIATGLLWRLIVRDGRRRPKRRRVVRRPASCLRLD